MIETLESRPAGQAAPWPGIHTSRCLYGQRPSSGISMPATAARPGRWSDTGGVRKASLTANASASAVWRSGFISPNDPLWARLLDQGDCDVYQTPQYVKLAAAHENAEPVAFYAVAGDESCLIPLLLRRVPDPKLNARGWRDAASPYGYGGMLLSRNCPPARCEQFLRAFQESAAGNRIVTAFLRMNPTQPVPADSLPRIGELRNQGEIVVAQLDGTDDERWRGMRRNHRRTIRKLRERQFTTAIDQWEYYGAFVRLYRENMARLGASPYYLFSDEYFAGLRRELGGMLHLWTVLSPERELAAAALFTSLNGVGHHHLIGTAARYLDCAPSTLGIDSMLGWGSRNGLRYLNLGGGFAARKDSLFEFKAGFSRLRMNFMTCRSVLHPPTYDALMARVAASDGTDDYFPAYRRMNSVRVTAA